MTILNLLIGLTLIIPIFAAFIWSAAQAFRQTGWLQYAHAASAALTLLGMASISYKIEPAAQFTGLLLGTAAGIAIWLESGWSKLFPIALLLLAIVLILKIPFVQVG